MEFIVNEFLKDAKQITITNNKIIDENGNERKPKIATPQQLKNGGIYCYKNLNNDVIIESLENADKIKAFIKDYHKKEEYAREKDTTDKIKTFVEDYYKEEEHQRILDNAKLQGI